VLRVLESGCIVLGVEVERFERQLAAYCSALSGVGVNSGASALHVPLLAAGVGPGDEVVTVSFSFVATADATGLTGATPVYVDIEARSVTIDVDRIEATVTGRTLAIAPVHFHGKHADVEPIREIARRHGLLVIEDASGAHGSGYNGRSVGLLAEMA
jgi:dTDP-4-amino-4,6-dideoxygalactose transaminase